MKPLLLTTALLLGLGIGGGSWVSAQTAPAAKSKPAPAHVHPEGAAAPAGGMQMMGGGMGMRSMHGGMGMPGGMCGMAMGAADTKYEVKNVDKGVTITITSTDPAKVTRLQKMAEAMRLMHEATAP